MSSLKGFSFLRADLAKPARLRLVIGRILKASKVSHMFESRIDPAHCRRLNILAVIMQRN
jgi:hypothetical protein